MEKVWSLKGRTLIIRRLPKTQLQAVVMAGCACSRGQRQNHNQKNKSSAWRVFLSGSAHGDEGADDQSGDEASDVSGVIDSRNDGAEYKVVDDKATEAFQRASQGRARHRKLAEFKSCDERTSEAE